MSTVSMLKADVRDLTLPTSYANTSLSTTKARTGTYSYAMTGDGRITQDVASNATYAVRAAIYFANYINNVSINFVTAGTGNSAYNVRINLYARTGCVTVEAYSGAFTYHYACQALQMNTWIVVEAKVYHHDTAGTVDLRINGETICALTNLDTKYSTNVSIGSIRFTYHQFSQTAYVDDVVIDDVNLPGLGGIITALPSGNGSHTAWTNDYTSVDENPPNDDTDYISTDAAVTGTKETHVFADLSTTVVAVARVAVISKAKLDASGTANLQSLVRSNSNDYTGATKALTTSYAWAGGHWDTDPGDSGAWSRTKVDAAEFGMISA